MKKQILILVVSLFTTTFALALVNPAPTVATEVTEEVTEFDPYAQNAEEQLKEFDAVYEQETGLSAYPETELFDLTHDLTDGYTNTQGCVRDTCAVYLAISKAEQKARLFVNGTLQGEYDVSTGLGNRTPDFDKRPNGRIYDKKTSGKYPGGDYNGLGNMPYAVFIEGGFAVHGTPRSNWSKLGQKASHGCIRMHPDNAFIFNRLVREYGVKNTWITVY